MPCFAPSEIPGLTPPTASAFGLIAESFIAARYLVHRGKNNFFPLSQTDFQDISVGFGNTPLYIAFLKNSNSHLSVSKLLFFSAAGLLKIPDLATHDGSVKEFYEIKPNSMSGRIDGRAKVIAIEAANHMVGIPYVSGTRWSPNAKFIVFSGPVFGAHIEVTFHFFRNQRGLIVYELCVEGELAKLAIHILFAILIAIIMILLSRGGIVPIPAPVPA